MFGEETMKLKVNGEVREVSQTIQTIEDLLQDLNINLKFVAIELNQQIIDPETFSDTNISEADQVEIVSFVGGG
jgi:sulfur carrier protein